MKRVAAMVPLFAAGMAMFAASLASAKVPAAAPSAGARAYQRCYACHSLTRGEGRLTGPNLYRIVGKRIAAEPGFAYSPAFRRFAARERIWTRRLLDRFIADPEAVVPGNAMGYFGLHSVDERAALVAYIAAGRKAPRP